MKTSHFFTKLAAISGTVLVWIPVLFTVITSVIGTLTSGRLRFDFLMPAELFPFALGGAILLVFTALRTRFYRKYVVIGFTLAILCLFGGQGIAVVSGLASGAIAPAGLVWAAVVVSIVIYSLSVVELGIVGILIALKLYRSK